MKTKVLTLATLAFVATFFITSHTHAFWEKGFQPNFTQEKFEELKQLFLTQDFESFKTTMQTKREEMKSQREKMKLLRESVTRTVENIENGVVMTLTSDNEEMVDHLQSHDRPEPLREGVTKTKENLTNGIRVILTSDDEELVERIQSRHQQENGKGKNKWGRKGRMGKCGFGKNENGRFGRGMGFRGGGQE
jgi:ATP-dependent 26S proteasome regulatory subunit